MDEERPQEPQLKRRSLLRLFGFAGAYLSLPAGVFFALAGPERPRDPEAEKLRSNDHEPFERLKQDRFARAERARSALQQSLVQAPFDVTLSPEAVYRRADENARSHGCNIAEYLACREELRHLDDPAERFEVLREFSRTNFKRDLRWTDPSPTTMSDVYAIYEGLAGLSLFAPIEVFDAVHARMPPGPMQAFEFVRDGHPKLNGWGGYAPYPHIVVGVPTEEAAKSDLVRRMCHEFAHILEDALLPDMKRIVRANDPSTFGEISGDYYERSESKLGPTTVVSSNYGRVGSERFTTLADRSFAFLDVASFDGFTASELIPGSTSVRVISFCRALAYYAEVIDGLDPSGKRDLLSYMLSMIVTPDRSFRQNRMAAEYAARRLIDPELAPQLVSQQTTELCGSTGKTVCNAFYLGMVNDIEDSFSIEFNGEDGASLSHSTVWVNGEWKKTAFNVFRDKLPKSGTMHVAIRTMWSDNATAVEYGFAIDSRGQIQITQPAREIRPSEDKDYGAMLRRLEKMSTPPSRERVATSQLGR